MFSSIRIEEAVVLCVKAVQDELPEDSTREEIAIYTEKIATQAFNNPGYIAYETYHRIVSARFPATPKE